MGGLAYLYQHLSRHWLRLLVTLSLAIISIPAIPAYSAPVDNTGIEIPILAYHNIAEDPQDDPWTISTAEFAAELDVLEAYGYTTVTLQDYLDYQNNLKTPPAKPVILTFDDGYRGMYTQVLPALQARGMVASFFIPTGKIAENDEDRVDNSWSSSSRLDYHMIWSEVQGLAAAGMEIGSHSETHLDLTGLSAQKQEQELLNSRIDLENHLSDTTITTFAYPNGEGGDDPVIRERVAAAGYSLALDYVPPEAVAVVGSSELLNLPRQNMINGVTRVLNCENPWWYFMRRVDPLFPITDIQFSGIQLRDTDNHYRTKMVPGEKSFIGIKATNLSTGCSADVSASLVIEKSGEVVYDSHQQTPVADIILKPFSNSSIDQNFVYSWQIPSDAASGRYDYRFCVYDVERLRIHFCSPTEPLVEVVSTPILVQTNIEPVHLYGDELQSVDLSIINNGNAGKDTYFTVSISSKLRIDEDILVGPWTHYKVGDQINCKTISGSDCTGSMPAVYETFVIYLKYLPAESQTFSLPVTSVPGASEGEWLRYRLRVDYSPNPFGDGEAAWPLRWPWFGMPDQQGWFAAVLPVEVQRSDVFLPLINR